MRRVAVALALAGAWLLAPISAYADPDLTALVNAAYFPRTESAELHDIAHKRAVEVSKPGGWCHCGQVPGTAEVLAYNSGFDDPASTALSQWQGSSAHHALLADPTFDLIGCGSHQTDDGTTYLACVLMAAPSIQTTPIPTPGPTGQPPNVGGSGAQWTPLPAATPPPLLPDTRMP